MIFMKQVFKTVADHVARYNNQWLPMFKRVAHAYLIHNKLAHVAYCMCIWLGTVELAYLVCHLKDLDILK